MSFGEEGFHVGGPVDLVGTSAPSEENRAPNDLDRIDLNDFIKLTGRATEDVPFYRHYLWEILEDRLPRGPLARVRYHISEVLPSTWSTWHVHNGPAYHVVLQGTMGIERVGEEPPRPDPRAVYEYRDLVKAGECITEPIGLPHRAGNPNPDRTLIVLSLLVADSDRAHIVPVGEPPADYKL